MRLATHSIFVSALIAAALGTAPYAHAQQSFTGAPIVYDFTGYAGAGLQSTPLSTQLDTDEFQVIANSTTTCLFGALTCPATTFARGASPGGVSTSGLYAFTTIGGNVAFGVQPASTVFGGSSSASTSAGSIWIRFVNATGGALGTVRLADRTWIFNNEANTSQITTFFTNDTAAAAPRVAVTMQTTPIVADATPAWTPTDFSAAIDLSSLAVADGGFFYLVFAINDAAGGSSNRDEIAFDDIILSRGCGDGVSTAGDGEACDAGAANGTTVCGCQTNCQFGLAATACAPTSGASCDLPDTCNGSGLCVDRFVAAGTSCRAVVSVCDVEELCSGTAASCPVDGFQPAGFVCAPTSGALCDLADICSGTSTTCAPRVAAAGAMCRAASGVCDAIDTCDGVATTCTDAHAADGTPCADALACNGDEACVAGACAPGAPIDCGDGMLCTADSCAEPGTCSHSAITDCCVADSDCTDAAVCTADTCDLSTNECVHTPIADCCSTAADCDDANACTTNTCDTDRMCVSVDVVDCCNTAGDCDDGDACTTDDCTGVGGSCTHDAIAGCGVDAGTGDAAVTDDAGTMGVDAGVRDAATGADTGVTSDAARLDGASGSDAGTGTTDAGGCSCRVGGGARGPSASLFALGLAGVLIARRRRRR